MDNTDTGLLTADDRRKARDVARFLIAKVHEATCGGQIPVAKIEPDMLRDTLQAAEIADRISRGAL